MNQNKEIGTIITLITGVGIVAMVLILIVTLGGSTYNLIEEDIDGIGAASASGTFTALNTSWVYLDNSLIQLDTLTIVNATSVSTLANFSVNRTTGMVLLTSGDAVYNNTLMTYGYTYDTSTQSADVREGSQDGIVSAFRALSSTGNYLPIIVLSIIITIVIGMIFSSLGGIDQTKFGGKGGNAL